MYWDRLGRDRMAVRFTTTRCTALCDKVCY